MASYQVANRAEADLDEIWECLDEQAGESVADRQIDQCHEQFQFLAENPFLGSGRPQIAPDLRSWPVGSYIILYRPTDDGVETVRVRHGRRRDLRNL